MTSVIKIFLASPSDLSEERKIVNARVEHFNKLWADKFDVYFRVVGWEDIPPSAQRPQQRINSAAEGCELFIGLLAARWGSETGAFSSGFEEEFHLAKTRKTKSGVPEISLYFKILDEQITSDPGPQLSKVLQFKQDIIQTKEFLFKEFRNLADFSDCIDALLVDFTTSKQQNESRSIKTNDESYKIEETIADSNNIETVLNNIKSSFSDDSKSQLDFWTQLRILLYSISIYSGPETEIKLGVHESNFIYRKRKQWILTFHEELTLIKAMLSDPHAYSPGWYWLSNLDIDIIRLYLWHSCFSSNANVKKSAASILAYDTKLTPNPEELYSALVDPVSSPSISQLVSRIGTKEHIPTLIRAKSEFSTSGLKHFFEAEFSIRHRTADEMTTEMLSEFVAQGVAEALPLLSDKIQKLDDASVISLLKNAPTNKSRERLLKVFFESGKIGPDVAKHFLSDESKRVRELCVRALVRTGYTFSRSELNEIFPNDNSSSSILLGLGNSINIDDLILLSLEHNNFNELSKLVDFFESDGSLAFKLLLQHHWESYKDKLEHQIDTDFDCLIEEADELSIKKIGIQVSSLWKKNGLELINYMKSKYIIIALEESNLHNHLRTSEWAQKYSRDSYPAQVRQLARQILVLRNAESDIDNFLMEFQQLPATEASKHVPFILQHSDLDAKTFELLALHPSELVHETIYKIIITDANINNLEIIKSILLSENNRTRMLAAKILTKMLTISKLEEILDQYIELPTYYYDVVTVFDKFLYSTKYFPEITTI